MTNSIKSSKFDWKIFIILAAAVVIIQITYYFIVHNYVAELDKQGQFGDTFGALTALFSGFAFAGMITAIVLQTKELGYQRQELEYTRDEITAQKEILRKQNFNNSFYRLLDYYKQNLSQISIRNHDDSKTKKGIDALCFLLDRLSKSLSKHRKYYSTTDEDKMLVYEFHLCLSIQTVLLKQARYLGTFKSLLLLVDTQLDSETEKKTYWKIIESQLTAYEIQYLFYHSLAETDDEFSRLINESKVLKDRMETIGVSRYAKLAYERLHGVKFEHAKHQNKLPHERKLITEAKKRIRLKEKT